jgi:hypothetical protein
VAPKPQPGPAKPSRPPVFQFSILGLMVLMLAVAMIGAPVYYFLRGLEGHTHMRLIGMIGMLAGPLLLTIAVSLLVAVAERMRRR